ncbi:alkaline phosphatase D family protein [Roseateles amylovorans]|uniref:Alkaline phosphatase family protein n=1 Tax=Roseateles amylovorans TaxID=2978473 RepID=A0ABY6B1R2_9BURK|nr:alkaline phosphatase D family protein [Roseateles amylovorans]UXH79000.1 alkaline phosphatase family protein [Roseateles amylovorans]
MVRASHLTRRQLLLAGSLATPLAGCAVPEGTTPAGPATGDVAIADGSPAPRRFRIGFGSCAKQSKPQPIWRAIGAAKPDLFVFLGDNLYADARDAATLRQRYAEFMAVAPLQDFRRTTPHLAIWDDHDFGDDDEGADYPLKQLSQQLFCDAWGEPADSPRRRADGIYQSNVYEAFGRRIQVILPDLRFNRSALTADPSLKSSYAAMVLRAKLSGQPMTGWYVPDPSPKATMLGEAQWQWLEAQLRVPADVRLIGSSVQFAAEGSGWECWANFPHERARLINLIRDTGANGVVFLSGDMHYAEMSSLPVEGSYPLWDATSSGLTEVWDIPTPNRNRRSAVVAELNFGLLDIEPIDPIAPPADAPGAHPAHGPAAGDLRLRFSLCDVNGRAKVTQVLTLSDLQQPLPVRSAAADGLPPTAHTADKETT